MESTLPPIVYASELWVEINNNETVKHIKAKYVCPLCRNTHTRDLGPQGQGQGLNTTECGAYDSEVYLVLVPGAVDNVLAVVKEITKARRSGFQDVNMAHRPWGSLA